MAINLTKVGGLVDIQGLGATEYIVDSSSTRPSIKLFGTNNVLVLSTSLGVINIPFASVTDFQVEGVAVTDLADFKTKIATVFPNEGGGSGSTPNIDSVLAVVPATLTEDRNIDTDGFNLTINGIAIGGGITNITYANLVTAINGSTLSAGQTYKITDRGDRGLFFTAISTNQLAKDGTRLMLCPATYATEIDGSSNDWIGVWNITKSAAAGQLTIWGGLVWENLTGAIGTADDDIALDAVNWEIIPKATFDNDEYVEMIFGCRYDVPNDWVESQWDAKGNVFGIQFLSSFNINGYNYCDVSDWNSQTATNDFFNNKCIGVFNNSNTGHIYRNYVQEVISGNSNSAGSGNIIDNWCGASIKNNSIEGNIIDNFINSDIDENTNTGDIRGNRCDVISGNSNTGSINRNVISKGIEGNSNLGSISDNMNNGGIEDCDSGVDQCDIINNINNGSISGTFAANVTDTIVNKS